MDYFDEASIIDVYCQPELKATEIGKKTLTQLMFYATLRELDERGVLEDMIAVKECAEHLLSFPLERRTQIKLGEDLMHFVNDADFRAKVLPSYADFKPKYDLAKTYDRVISLLNIFTSLI